MIITATEKQLLRDIREMPPAEGIKDLHDYAMSNLVQPVPRFPDEFIEALNNIMQRARGGGLCGLRAKFSFSDKLNKLVSAFELRLCLSPHIIGNLEADNLGKIYVIHIALEHQVTPFQDADQLRIIRNPMAFGVCT